MKLADFSWARFLKKGEVAKSYAGSEFTMVRNFKVLAIFVSCINLFYGASFSPLLMSWLSRAALDLGTQDLWSKLTLFR